MSDRTIPNDVARTAALAWIVARASERYGLGASGAGGARACQRLCAMVGRGQTSRAKAVRRGLRAARAAHEGRLAREGKGGPDSSLSPDNPSEAREGLGRAGG